MCVHLNVSIFEYVPEPGGDVYAPDNMRVIRIVDEVKINNAVRSGKVAEGREGNLFLIRPLQ